MLIIKMGIHEMEESLTLEYNPSQPTGLSHVNPVAEQNITEYKAVYVEWTDAYGINGGWTEISSLKEKDLAVNTLGYLVVETDTFIGVSSTIDRQNLMCHNCIIIPRQMIIRMTDFGVI